MEIALLKDIAIIFGLAIAVIYLCHLIKLPSLVGLLLTGILAGPRGLGLINAVHEVEILAEIGVILLLFSIGIEFSLKKLLQIKRFVLIGGALQVGGTILIVYLIARQVTTWSAGQAIFMGFLISLSSTAIVLKLYQARMGLETPSGRLALGLLLFQDVIVVLMLLLTPTLAGEVVNPGRSLSLLAATGIGVILFVIVSAQYLVPMVLHQIMRTRSRELFLLSIAGICFTVALVTSSVGLSLALGAFLAGLTISESEYSHEALDHILPFREIFSSFFFVSIGMLFDVGFVFSQPIAILFITMGILLVKALLVTGVAFLLGFPLRAAIISGLGLSQVGEFAFVLGKAGSQYNLFSGDTEQLFITVSVLSMMVTPFLIMIAPAIADFIQRGPLPSRLRGGLYAPKELDRLPDTTTIKDHLVIIGFGVNGINVAKAAQYAGIPYLVIDANPETVRAERAKHIPIFYGDATQTAILNRAHVAQARTVVIAMSEAAATRRITALVRKLNPLVYIITRTRYVRELEPLYKLGANEVIPEEYETSVEIFGRVLTKYLVPQPEIEQLIAEIRADGYQMFRRVSAPKSVANLHLELNDLEIGTILVAEGSSIAGQSLSDTGLRNRTGLTLLAIGRQDRVLTDIDRDTQIQVNDELYVIGRRDKITAIAAHLFDK